jgi:hypothetical protein
LTVLRLHDVNRSAWWLLLFFVPYLGGLASLALSLWPGDAEDNEYYGPPPPDSGSLPAIGVLVLLCLTLGLGWNMAWSALQRQIAAIQADAGPRTTSRRSMTPRCRQRPSCARAAQRCRGRRVSAATWPRPGTAPSPSPKPAPGVGMAVPRRPDQAMETAVADCERRRRPYTPACEVVAPERPLDDELSAA